MRTGIMTKEEFEIRAQQYQAIIEDIYAACCELKQETEKLSKELDKLKAYLARKNEEEYF